MFLVHLNKFTFGSRKWEPKFVSQHVLKIFSSVSELLSVASSPNKYAVKLIKGENVNFTFNLSDQTMQHTDNGKESDAIHNR